MVRKLLILGSTGSIGTQALDVVERSDELRVVGLAAQTSADQVLEQAAATAWSGLPWPTRTRPPAPGGRYEGRCSPAPKGWWS